MELKTIKKNAKELEIEIIDENETILNPIKEVLLQNRDVEYAAYMCEHPESKKRRLYLRVKNGKPEEILAESIKKLQEEIKNFIKDFESKIKKEE